MISEVQKILDVLDAHPAAFANANQRLAKFLPPTGVDSNQHTVSVGQFVSKTLRLHAFPGSSERLEQIHLRESFARMEFVAQRVGRVAMEFGWQRNYYPMTLDTAQVGFIIEMSALERVRPPVTAHAVIADRDVARLPGCTVPISGSFSCRAPLSIRVLRHLLLQPGPLHRGRG